MAKPDWLAALNGTPVTFSISDYGPTLAANKQRIVKFLRGHGGSDAEVLSVLAIGMQETQHLEASERDASKDNAGAAANFSCFNMNLDMLTRVGYKRTTSPDLNDQKHLEVATNYLLTGIRFFTLNGMLAFHRGGYTSWQQFVKGGQDGYRKNDIYDVQGYINCFTTSVLQMRQSPELLADSRRVDVYCAHQ